MKSKMPSLHLATLIAQFIINSALAFSPPLSWDQLQTTVPSLSKPLRPIYHDKLPTNDDDYVKQQLANPTPTLYRDKDCICAASQTVWLALECKNVEYSTVLVSKEDGDPCIPRIEWPTDNLGETTNDPIKLLEQIQSRYPNTAPQFYPKVSMSVDASRCNIMRLPGIMPRYSEPTFMDRAPWIFRDNGSLVKKSSHCVSLEEVDETQEEYYLGAYFCGEAVSAADMVWAPYLERYAIQLPLLFPNMKSCNPRSKAYEEVNAWYQTMENKLPAYACCVQGDARHWRHSLEEVILLHNERATSDEERVTSLPPVSEKFGWWLKKNPRGEELWKEYAEVRPWLGDTPKEEVALYLLRNRDDIVAEAASSMGLASDFADEALRELVQVLTTKNDASGSKELLSENARKFVNFVNKRKEVSIVAASAASSMDLAPDNADEALRELVQMVTMEDDVGSVEELLSENARKLAEFVIERIEVPRDMGMIPAQALWQLIQLPQ